MKKDESYLEYKKRVIDTKSKSFCGAKWYNSTIWLGSGTTTSCHHPPAHKIDVKELADNPSAIHNTKHKKLMRKMMQQGDRPNECDYCWKIEDIGRDNISDRVFKTVIYSDEELQEAMDTPYEKNINLKTLEIAFDRTCNFGCSYCNASFSTTWAKDIKKNGPYQHLVSDGAGAFQHDGGWAQPYKIDEFNPYIDAFWRWWPELSKTLTELRITGGEPLMSPDVWRLFDFFEREKSDIKFSVNSNLGGKDELIDKLIEKSHNIKSFDLYTSNEAMGVQSEYIRDGLEWNRWVNNCEKVIENANLRAFHMMMTINSLCLFSITDFMDLMLDWKMKYGKHFPTWSVNLVRFPSFMSPLALPDHIKNERREHLQKWLNSKIDHPKIHKMEIAGVSRLIDYLETVDAPHRRVSGKQSLWRDFKTFYDQYDLRRNKKFDDIFPEILVDWKNKIPQTILPNPTGLVDGDSTKGWHDDKEINKLIKEEGWEINPQTANPGSVEYKE